MSLNKVIIASTPNDGSFSWVIPMTQALGQDFTVKITRTTFSVGSPAATDTSNAYFALIPETLTVTSPDGGENWVGGSTHSITWLSTGNPTAFVKIELVKPGALNKVIISSTPNDGSYDWVIPMTQILGSDFTVKITRTTFSTGSTAATDTSDTYFALIPETLAVTSPNGGESWVGGSTNEITWTSTGNPKAYVKIELVKSGSLNKVIVSSTPNDGSYTWAIPLTQPLGSDYTVKITRLTYPAGSKPANDTSDGYFALIPEALTVTSPDGGESWVSGNKQWITWTSTGNPKSYVRIELVKPGVANKVVISSTLNDGSFDWTVPLTLTLGSDYTVKITRTTFSTGSAAATDSSDSNFAIVPEVVMVSNPIGGEGWVSGTTHAITWRFNGNPTAFVKIELLKAGVLKSVISSGTINDGWFDWTIPLALPLGGDYSVRITRTTYPAGGTPATDSSDAYFSIISENLIVTSPNGGESWARGTVHGITWVTTGGQGAYVRIELLKGGVLNRVIVSSALNKGIYSWTMPTALTLGEDYSVRVTRTSGSRVSDSSDAYFNIPE